MIKVSKNFILAIMSFVLLIATCFTITYQGPTRNEAYASLNPNTLLSKQSTIVNNVILFSFSDHASRVKNGTAFTQNTTNFVNSLNHNLNVASDSLQAYYRAMSNGQFTIESHLVMDTNNSLFTSSKRFSLKL